MKILILKKERIITTSLPNNVYGDFQIVDIDENGNQVDLITIKEQNGKWLLTNTNDTAIIVNNAPVGSIYLTDYFSCEILYRKSDYKYILYCLPTFDKTTLYNVVDANITIGNSNSDIVYYNDFLKSFNVKIYYDNAWYIEVLTDTYLVYLNNKSVQKERLFNGDVIFILGLRIVVLGNYMIINNPYNMVKINANKLKIINLGVASSKNEIDEELDIYDEEDYFFRTPRFKRSIVLEKFHIDSPPENQDPEGMPFFLTLASSMTMAATSSMSLYTAVSRLNEGATFKEILPTLIITLITLIASFVVPVISRIWQKRSNKKKEKLRQEKYTNYVEERKKEIDDKMEEQKFILVENNLTNKQCFDIIMNKENNLWERKIDHDDFLNLRIGIGNIKAEVEVDYEKERFTLVDDNLKQLLQSIAGSEKELADVPVSISLTEKNVIAITSELKLGYQFLETLVLQMMAFHSYEELKIVILTTEENQNYFEYLKLTPFVWNNQKSFRFFGINKEEINQISLYLTDEFNNRKFKDKEHSYSNDNVSYKDNLPYYVIITDDYKTIRNIEIFNSILDSDNNFGFTLITIDRTLRRLPDDAKAFINLTSEISLMLEPDLTKGVKQEFKADFNTLNMNLLTNKVANVPIEFQDGLFNLPTTYTFLEMYNVGRVEQLNILARWKDSNPINSLAAPVGISETGDMLYLDVHEKVHGPHGLIAGMTGSGKSEFIITYILSMAVNYRPEEVSFVLIDYKGGGLAGAFENKDTGIKLPHIAGIITNLDKTEINRALSSLNSELRRRQKVFNEARDKLNESTIDIYKYQKLYRNGQVDEPMSHLIIVSDEFAELKMQQPEFMDELMSIARIGRSLGVHLILATQKPSGIVNDQIWSNSRFKVCLKVQDKSDSMDMLKRPDAANITNIGAFFLQVGFNEYFYYGQSAWSGAAYYPSDFRIKKVDTAIDFINNYGAIYKTVDFSKKNALKSQGEEITNIIRYLDDIANKENIMINQLWLNRIPDFIKVDALKNKYNYQKNLFISPIIGELDDPVNQQQHLLTLPINEQGNTIIYGIPGSGKELVLTTIVYSSATLYSPEEVNFYILDFSSETMSILRELPQVGDVILASDKDKLENLFKLINTYLAERRQLFLNYNGSIIEYKKATGKNIPSIIVMINGFDSFNEMYSDYVELLTKYTRECPRFGIYFIITATGTTSVRYKLSQNFKNIIALELNDKSDYYSVIGKTTILPSKAVGRGLVKINDSIYEFQTAYPTRKEDSSKFFKELAVKLKEQYPKKALKIPVLPDKVTMNSFQETFSLEKMPIGIYKDNLENSYFDFKKQFFNKITANELENTTSFVKELLIGFNQITTFKTYLLDSNNTFNENYFNITKYNTNFDEVLTSITNNINTIYEEASNNNFSLDIVNKYQPMLFVIYDFTSFKKKLNSDLGSILSDLYKKSMKLPIINFIVIDAVDAFKKVEFESWFKEVNDPETAIWIGEGISNQFSIKLARSSDRALQAPIKNDFGYIVLSGKHALIKVLQFDPTELPKENPNNEIEELI